MEKTKKNGSAEVKADNAADEGNDNFYTVVIGSLLTTGPSIHASVEELKDFFDGVTKFNEEEGKEIVRVYRPS